MALNKSKGNMYKDVTHTWNPIKGECPHKCKYCYMKRFGKQKPPRLDEKEFKTDLGSGKLTFVGSSIDIFADTIPNEWIVETLKHCEKFPDNKYLLQTKNPKRFKEFSLPVNRYILGTTIETNRNDLLDKICEAPGPLDRAINLSHLPNRKFITIEPIMSFDLNELSDLIRLTGPEWVNIGADSQGHNLSEPKPSEILLLIIFLNLLILEDTHLKEIKLKNNLKRLTGGMWNDLFKIEKLLKVK